MLKIEKVSSKKQLRSFIMLPFDLYKNDPAWVPPLIQDQYKFFDAQKNPYYLHSDVQLFLLMEGNKSVGRISAHTNTQHQKEQ